MRRGFGTLIFVACAAPVDARQASAKYVRFTHGAETPPLGRVARDAQSPLGLTRYLTESWVIGRGNFAASIA